MIESKQVKEWENEGRREQAIESVLEILKEKFGTIPTELPGHLEALHDLAQLRPLLREAMRASSLDDFRNGLPNGRHNGESH